MCILSHSFIFPYLVLRYSPSFTDFYASGVDNHFEVTAVFLVDHELYSAPFICDILQCIVLEIGMPFHTDSIHVIGDISCRLPVAYFEDRLHCKPCNN